MIILLLLGVLFACFLCVCDHGGVLGLCCDVQVVHVFTCIH